MTQQVRQRQFGASVLFAACLGSTQAHAQDVTADPPYSIDIEFIRPQFGHEGFAGVDAPLANRSLTLRYGTVIQYEQSPLTLYEAIDNQELGAVVTNRFSAQFGASLDVERVTFSVVLPTAANWGTEQDAFGQDGFGVGDFGAAAKLVALRTPHDVFNLGVRGGLILPTGRKEAYIGENRLRLTGSLLASLQGGPLLFATDFGVQTRTKVETSEDFVASNEVVWGNAVRYRLPDASHLALNAQLLSRAGFAEFLRGGAENALEAVGGIEIYPTRHATIHVGAGRGLTQGYGTTDFRILTGLVIEAPPPERQPGLYTNETPPPPRPPPPIEIPIEEPPEVKFEEGEIVKQVGQEIFIRDMVEFVVDTNIIQDYSKNTLSEVAKYINNEPMIAHLVIEGHASQEGSYEHNYTLAESRSRRIWEFLMEQGVAKDRISYRGMGEVEPVIENGAQVLGEDEASLQKNRRVRFLVVRQYEGSDQLPNYPDSQILPWNGNVVTVVKPPPPVIEPPKETGPKLDEFGLPIDDDEDGDKKPGDTGKQE
ncbi:MAG: OmpA family protein [Myxococcota bacterium]